MSLSSESLLAEFLADAYGKDLLIFPAIADYLTERERRDLVQSLPMVGGVLDIARYIVHHFFQRGMVNELFFAFLYRSRYRRRGEIKVLSRMFGLGRQRQGTVTVDLRPTVMLSSRYELVRDIGSGSYGTIWLAHDLAAARGAPQCVALKFLHGGKGLSNEDRRIRFFRGALKISGVNTPGVARILDPQCTEEGHDFYVMEYIEGLTLFEAVRQQTLNTMQFVDALFQIGKALSVVHSQGLIHRDVKPQNIMLSHVGVAKLIDFDLARDSKSDGFTETGALGTRLYAPPEMYTPGELDQRADVFGLGMTAIFVFYDAAELPPDAYPSRSGGTKEFLQRFIRSEQLIRVLVKATAWLPNDRYSSVDEFCDQLRSAIRHNRSKKRTKTRPLLRSVMMVSGLMMVSATLAAATHSLISKRKGAPAAAMNEAIRAVPQPSPSIDAEPTPVIPNASTIAVEPSPKARESQNPPSTARVVVNVNPSHAKVSLIKPNGTAFMEVSASTPVFLERMAGLTYRVECRGYKPMTSEIVFGELQEIIIDVNLERLPVPPQAKTAELKLGSDSGLPPATVWVDGEKQPKPTPVTVMVTPGVHRIKWKYPDGTNATMKVTAIHGDSVLLKGKPQ